MEKAVDTKRTMRFALLMLAFEALLLALWAYTPIAMEKAVPQFGLPIAFAFAGLTLGGGSRRKLPACYWVGFAALLWYVASRVLLGDRYLQRSHLYFARTAINQLVAFPFAFWMADAERKRGLDVLAAIYSIAFSALAAFGVLAALLGRHLYLPLFSTEIYCELRLFAGQHPNGSAMLFLMGVVLTLYLMFRYPRKAVLVVGGIMLLFQYVGIAFTVSRTVMVECALIPAVLAFSLLLRQKRWQKARRVCAAIVAAALCFGLCYAGFSVCASLQNSFTASAEAVAPATIQQRSFFRDLLTLTDRTSIYRDVFTYVGAHPRVLLTGMLEPDIVTNLQREVNPDFWLAHNAWLQALLTTGLPGLLLALAFTWLTLKGAVGALLVHHEQTSFAEKLAALLPALLLLNCVTECVLFAEQFSVGHFAFLLCLGYTLEGERARKANTKQMQ